MTYQDHTISRLLNEWGVSGYSGKRKAELIEMLRASNSRLPDHSKPQPTPPTWEPMRPPRPRPQHPMRRPPPPPPSQALPSVRFRPDRQRQPELLRQLD